MMSRMNCWEFFDCGREPEGKKAAEYGVCPAASSSSLNGINDGANGGRSCWAIAGTYCGGKPQGTYAQKLGDCLKCDFHTFVRYQQRESYVKTRQILDILAGKITASCVNKGENTELKKAV
ncbi:MAG: two-CW domain-containing protein [Desulfobulbaceae bacterium]